MLGYKAMNGNKCLNFIFEVGQTYEIEGNLEICSNGFHFCQEFMDLNNYYLFSHWFNRYYEIEALGEVITNGDKSATNKIKILRQLTQEDILSITKEKLWFNSEWRFHREDGPAVEYANGTKQWWVNGMRHREDGPAIEGADGYKEWYLNGNLHREDGPAIEGADGYKEWYLNGNLHREDGPAVEGADGYKAWWVNGKRHREDGPAVEYADGSKKTKTHKQEF
jgi:hypothetical protein